MISFSDGDECGETGEIVGPVVETASGMPVGAGDQGLGIRG
jgi:hypothetical protein